MKELVLGLLLWISSHSQLAYDGDSIPQVISVTKSELVSEMFEGRVPYALDKNRVRAIGLYNFKTSTIYLLNRIDISTTRGKSVLLHELAHYLQYKHGINRKVKCKQQLEYLAYELQSAYLVEHDVSAGIEQSHIQKSSQCSKPKLLL